MLEIKGNKIKELPFPGLLKAKNLIEFDGPILSHFKDNNNNDVLFYWVDSDSFYNRWLVWLVSKDSLIEYLSGRVPLREILPKENEYYYLVDINDGINGINYESIVSTTTIPDEYKPEKNSFWFKGFGEY